jgi:mRNA-degrading endonuclease RelE of RelBE toxin-antitoxin system
VSWRVLLTETALEGLDDADRDIVSADLFLWVENGPPRRNRRMLRGIEVFEDELGSGYRLAYFVNDAENYVAVLRVRKND